MYLRILKLVMGYYCKINWLNGKVFFNENAMVPCKKCMCYTESQIEVPLFTYYDILFASAKIYIASAIDSVKSRLTKTDTRIFAYKHVV